MTTLAPPRGIRIGPEGIPDLTLGWQILDWCETNLRQPDGPSAGQPWRFTAEQELFVLWWYAVNARGQFIYRRGMLRRMKGWGKDPLGAVLCCIEFVGPCRYAGMVAGQPYGVPNPAAWIQTAAVSKDQTRNTMTLFPGMMSDQLIERERIDLGKEIIYARQGRVRIEAVTSSPRALEGGRPTFVLKNESHHWLSSNGGHEMAAVIARNAAKVGARVLAISNAHQPGEDSDAEHDYNAWVEIETGKSRATGFLYDSLEAPPDTDIDDDESLREGLLAARGDSIWLDVDRLIEEIHDPSTPVSDSRRFYLNQIIAREDAWIAPHEWDANADPERVVEPGTMITLGLDGSKGGDQRRAYDHTVLMACTVEDGTDRKPHLFPLGIWDPNKQPDNLVPTSDVDAAVRAAFANYDVVGFYSDVKEWETYIDLWEQDFGETLCAAATTLHPIRWPMNLVENNSNDGSRVVAAVEAYHDAIVERAFTHSDDEAINQYHYNCHRKQNNHGITFRKETSYSSRKIDGAAAAMLARQARQDYMALPENKKRKRKRQVGVTWV